MACEICDRMTTEVAVREKEYVDLRERMLDAEAVADQDLKLACDDASIDLQIARLELERHRIHHH